MNPSAPRGARGPREVRLPGGAPASQHGGSGLRQQQQAQQVQRTAGPGPQPGGRASGSPALLSLQREIAVALDVAQPLAARCTSLGKLHAVMAGHQAHKPAVAVAMLPLFLANWPQLVACLWDPSNPQLAAAAAPLVGVVGSLVASSRAAAAAADAAAAAQVGDSSSAPAVPASSAQPQHGPPPPPASLLFDWLLPLFTGAVPLPTGAPAPPQLQALLARTLAYALKQLPSCSSTPSSQLQPQHPDAPAATSSSSPEGLPSTTASTAGQEETVQQGLGTTPPTTPTAAPAGNDAPSSSKLLTVPVPPAAAQQLHQHATAVLQAVQQLLEAAGTPPELLGPLLQLLLEVIRVAHTVVTGGALQDLLDLLLGWSLEPGLQAKDRQLIARVLVALRPSWLMEPGLAGDIGARLLADMQTLLPPPPSPPSPQPPPAAAAAATEAAGPAAAAATAPAAAAPTDVSLGEAAAAEVRQGEAVGDQVAVRAEQPAPLPAEEQEQRLHKLLCLLSCLVAILTATGDTPKSQQLVPQALDFMESVHKCVSGHAGAAAAGQGVSGGVSGSSWAAAAVSVAGSMLAFWEAVVGTPVLRTAGHADGVGQQKETGAVEAEGVAAAAAVAHVDAAAVSQRVWSLVLSTLQLPMLPADDAVGLLGSICRALRVTAGGSGSGSSDDAQLQSGLPDRQVTALLPSSLTLVLWEATLQYRSSPLADVQAAAAAVYSVTALLSDTGGSAPKQETHKLGGDSTASSSSSSTVSGSVNSSRATQSPAHNTIMHMVLQEVSVLFGRLVQVDSKGGSSRGVDSKDSTDSRDGIDPGPPGPQQANTTAPAPADAATLEDKQNKEHTAGKAQVNYTYEAGQQQRVHECKQEQLLLLLLFDLVLLESWLCCAAAGPATGQQLAGAAATAEAEADSACSSWQPTAEALLGRHAAAVSHQVAEVLLSGLQQLLSVATPQSQQPPPPQPQQQEQQQLAAVCLLDDELCQQLLAVLEVLVAVVAASSTPAHAAAAEASATASTAAVPAPAVLDGVVGCVELLLGASHGSVAVTHQASAVQLLSQVLQQLALATELSPAAAAGAVVKPAASQAAGAAGSPAQAVSITHQASTASVTNRALSVLALAATAASADIRAAATEAAGAVARAVLAGLSQQQQQQQQWQEQQAGASTAVRLVCSLGQLLASRCCDTDAAIATAAQSSITGLFLPLYLLAVCSHSSSGASSTDLPAGIDSASPTAAAAGLGTRWKRLAALEPQQRAFKPAQLAQFFEAGLHASPAMLQRLAQRAAHLQPLQQQQPANVRFQATAATLQQLAHELPLLPAATGSSSRSSGPHGSGSSTGASLRFEDLSSAAVTGWLLTQEAARHCVSARMRTHLGNPTQSFGSLERILQAQLAQLQADKSPTALQRSWQRQLLQQMQAAMPRQHQHRHHLEQQGQEGGRSGQQPEPQQLLQAPGAAAGAAAGTAAASAPRRPRLQQQQQAAAAGAAEQGADAAAAAAEEARRESESAVGSLLDLMYALEVNIQAATEGSIMRPAVGKSVMAFFAGNKKVCEDWFCRTRESLLWLSATAGCQQHTLFHGMARLQELHSQLKALTAHSLSQQRLLQQERERQKAQQQEGSTAAAAAAAAAAAISGLGPTAQQDQQQQQQHRMQRGKQEQQQQQVQLHTASRGNTTPEQQRRVKSRPAPADSEQHGSAGTAASAAPAGAGTVTGLTAAEQLRLLQQQYQASLLQLAAPVLSTLVLLADSCVGVGEPFALLGLQQWVHRGFHAVWEAVSQLYAWDLLEEESHGLDSDSDDGTEQFLQGRGGDTDSTAAGSSSTAHKQAHQQQQQQERVSAPSMLLLSWVPAAAAQAAGRYEDALSQYGSFLASEACSTGLGAAVKLWVHEQMAACYAALADWTALAALCDTHRPQAAQQVQSLPWLQHWQLAGMAGVSYLQSWCLPAASQQQQQGPGSLHAIEQHLSQHSNAGRGSRSRGGLNEGSAPGSGGLPARLDMQQGCASGVSPAALALLHGTAALELCASHNSSSSGSGCQGSVGDLLQQQEARSDSGRGGRGRGHGRQALPPAAHAELTAEQQQEQQQQCLLLALEEVQQQLQALQDNPFCICPAASIVSSICSNSRSLSTGSGLHDLQQVSLLQLLRSQLLQHQQQQQLPHFADAAPATSLLQSPQQLVQWLGCLSRGSGGIRAEGLSGLIWASGLSQDGRVAKSLIGDVSTCTALLQCLPWMGDDDSGGRSSGGGGRSAVHAGRRLLLKEALLASCSHGCLAAMQRLVHVAAADTADSNKEEALWLTLLSSKLQLQAVPATSSAVAAVEAHYAVLQQPLQKLQLLSSRSELGHAVSPEAASGSAGAAFLSAAYLSLASSIQQAMELLGSWDQLTTACRSLQQVPWAQVHVGALQQLPAGEAPCCGAVAAAAAQASMQQNATQQQMQAALGCAAAAVAAAPQQPNPWKAYGDLLLQLAGGSAQLQQQHERQQERQQEQQQEHHVTMLYGAAAEAYCQHLAASANTGALASPQHSLGVLLKLLQVILQQGEQLEAQLSEALAACPAAVWQVLVNQLLAQLQHSSAAVRGLVQQLLQGLAVVVPCAVLYPLVVELRAAKEAGQEAPAELSALVSQLQRVQPRMLPDTVAMAEALERLTVTRWEAWAGLLLELSLETNRKLLSLRADLSRQEQQRVNPARRLEVFLSRYKTVMTPVVSTLQGHIAAATAAEPASPDEGAFREQMLPKLTELCEVLQTPPQELLKLASGEQSEDETDSEEASDDPAAAAAAASDANKQASSSTSSGTGRAATAAATAGNAGQSGNSGSGWELLKQLRQQLQQHLRRQQHLQLAEVAPQLSKLKNTAIPLPADDVTADTLPPLPLKAALHRCRAAAAGCDPAAAAPPAGASVLLTATGQLTAVAAAAGDSAAASPTPHAAEASRSSTSWLCIAAFDKQVAVLPTKTRPKRLLMLASDGSIHAFLLKGRDDLRVDERLMQFIRASNTLLTAEHAAAGPAAAAAAAPASATAAAVAGWRGSAAAPLRVRPYSITPFGRRAGLVQWVRHSTSLYGLFRNWQQATAERYQAVAAAKRDAASAAAAGNDKQQADGSNAAAAAAGAPTAAAGAEKAAAPGGSSVPLPLLVAAARPTDAFYARLLPALQAAGLPVGSSRSSWPASVLRSTFASLSREAPKSLLAKQLLSGAAEPGGWWVSQQAFTCSTAAGSIVGWLLGLGDRHMDNLLLDRNSCELVHIDFSVCFDKGTSLAVPEVVPFRLTQTMQVAFGPGGLSGPFSAAAAVVLSTLRGAADMLCSLLDLLLSDAAVDWSVDREAHAARKDQDTAVGLRLCASRLEELRHPLLSNLAAALPNIGNGLAAIVSYGEAHLYMQQLQATAAAAHARAAAASEAMSAAAADEVRAWTSSATAAKSVTSLTSDYRRLCGLAASCIQSAGNWLSRHQETLAGLGVRTSGTAASGGVGSSAGQQQQLLLENRSSWDVSAADRPLLLLTGNSAAAPGSEGGCSSGGDTGLLVQALGGVVPGAAATTAAAAGTGTAALQALLPPELVQQCLQLDAQGQQLLQQQQELLAQGWWSLAAYGVVLEQLLSGGGAYIKTSHHWAWSYAFQAAADGPELANVHRATATAPLLPSRSQVAATWTYLSACWGAAQLVQQQLGAALEQTTPAAADAAAEYGSSMVVAAAGQGASENEAVAPDAAAGTAAAAAAELSGALQQVAARLNSSSAEADAAAAQYVASAALAHACEAVTAATGAALAHFTPAQQTQQEQHTAVASAAGVGGVMPEQLQSLQLQLAALQAAFVDCEQSGLGFVLDPAASQLADELPEAAVSLEDMLDAGDDEAQAAALQAQQQPQLQQQQQQHWHQHITRVFDKLQLVQQLLLCMQHEALAPLAAGQAAAAAEPQAPSSSEQQRGEEQQALLLPAGPVSQQQLWLAAATHTRQHWQRLQQLLLQAYDLEAHMHSLAAVAAAGGAAAIWPEDTELLSHAVQLQQQLLPQGFDILTTEECVASAQLLQSQWVQLEHDTWQAVAAALGPLLGLPQPQDVSATNMAAAAGAQTADPGMLLLKQLAESAAAGTAAASVMHCKDVLAALSAGAAATAAAADGAAASGGSMWGVPGMCEATKGLVVVLLQYGCLLQQQSMHSRQQQVQELSGSSFTPGDGLQEGCVAVDLLRSTKELPMELEAQRPLLMVVQVLHELLCTHDSSAATSAASAAASAVPADPAVAAPAAPDSLQVAEAGARAAGPGSSRIPLLQRLQGILLPPLLQQLLPELQQQLQALQRHLAVLHAEAEQVLTRFQQQGRSSSPAQHGRATEDSSSAAAQQDTTMAAEGPESSGLDQPGSSGPPDLVPFDAFDMSLPGADVLLEELGSGLGCSAASDDSGLDALIGDSLDGSLGGGDDTAAAAAAAAAGTVSAAAPDDLEAFAALDEGLAGAGMGLQGKGDSSQGGGGGFFGDLSAADADLLGGSLEEEDTGPPAQHDDGRHGVQQPGAAPEAPCIATLAAEAEALGQQLLAVGQRAGAVSLQQQWLAGLQQVQDSCQWQQRVWLRHLAAFEWLWGDMVPQDDQQSSDDASLQHTLLPQQQLLQATAVLLGYSEAAVAPPAIRPGEAYPQFAMELLPQLPPQQGSGITSSSGATLGITQQQQQHHLPNSSQLLQLWQVLCEQQASLAEALQAWQAACVAAASAVADVLLGPVGAPPGHSVLQLADPSVCRKMLNGTVARAGHWLIHAAGLCSGLAQQAEAALQLEYSRRGRLWAPGIPEGVDAFQGNSALLQQLSAAATGLAEAQAQVAAAEALLASSQAAAAQAQLTIEEAKSEAAAAEQQLVLKTPAAIARAQGMLPVVDPMVAAAESALPYVTEGLAATLRALVTLVERNSAARDLAPMVKSVCLQHGRCLRVLQRLHGIGAAASAGLKQVLQGMRQWKQQQGQPLQQQQESAYAVLVATDPAQDAQLMQLLLADLQPALAGVKEELGELGQAHVLFTHLAEQLDSLAGAAETVAAAITSDHAMQLPAAASGRFAPPASSSSGGGRRQRAEARQRAFAAAALARCTARLTGQRSGAAAGAGAAADTASRSVSDEVAALVAAATSVDKLSRMYEGWASWL